jgi:hypothetical protein
VVLGRGVPRGDLITTYHVVVCDSPLDGKSGRDSCLSNGGSLLSRFSLDSMDYNIDENGWFSRKSIKLGSPKTGWLLFKKLSDKLKNQSVYRFHSKFEFKIKKPVKNRSMNRKTLGFLFFSSPNLKN